MSLSPPPGSPSSLFSAASSDVSDGDSDLCLDRRPPPPPAASLLPPPIPGLSLLPALLPFELASALTQSIGHAGLFAGGSRDQVMLFGERALDWARDELGAIRRWGDKLLQASDGGRRGPDECDDGAGGEEAEAERRRMRDVWGRCWRSDGRSRQAILNLYTPGKGIALHVDLPHRYGTPILSLSLLSSTVFLLRRRRRTTSQPSTPPPLATTTVDTSRAPAIERASSPAAAAAADDDDDDDKWETYRFLLPARSILMLDGPARYDWEHGIEPLEADRVALPPSSAAAARTALDGDDEGADESEEQKAEWRVRGTRVSMTLRWMLEGGDVVGG